MSFIKALYGTMVCDEFTIMEGGIGETQKPHNFTTLQEKGIVKIFDTYEEAVAFKYKSSSVLFAESFQSLNPPEGVTAKPSQIDFPNLQPVVVDGVPANHLSEAPKPEPVKVEAPKKAVAEPSKPKSTSQAEVHEAAPAAEK
jgi:hypothetical protein